MDFELLNVKPALGVDDDPFAEARLQLAQILLVGQVVRHLGGAP